MNYFKRGTSLIDFFIMGNWYMPVCKTDIAKFFIKLMCKYTLKMITHTEFNFMKLLPFLLSIVFLCYC